MCVCVNPEIISEEVMNLKGRLGNRGGVGGGRRGVEMMQMLCPRA